MKIEINDKIYNVKLAVTEDEQTKGLQGIGSLPEDSGMLFVYDEPDEISFWMKDTHIPLDIIFINEYWEVISVATGTPESEEPITEKNVQYVLELNSDSGVKSGDEVDLDELEGELKKREEEPEHRMHVLAPDGSTQMKLKGGERIFSIKNTKTLIRLAKKAKASGLDKDFKALGKKVFQYLQVQYDKDEDFVELPN